MLRRIAILALFVFAIGLTAPLDAQDAPVVFVYNAWLLTEDGRSGTVYASIENAGETSLRLTDVKMPTGTVTLTPMQAEAPAIDPGETFLLTPDTVGLFVTNNEAAPDLDEGIVLLLTFADDDGHVTSVELGVLPVDAPPELADIVVLSGWARPTALDLKGAGDPAEVISGAYLTLENRGDDADALVAVASPYAEAMEIHEMQMDGGIMRMRPMPALALEPGEQRALAPGGEHLMLISLTRHLLPGDVVPMILTFESGLELTVAVPVRDERSPMADDGDDMSGPGHSGHGG